MTTRSESLTAAVAFATVLAGASPVLAQQPAPRPTQTTPAPSVSGQAPRAERSALPQGFSVVLVLGDIQGTAMADDVPPAARKALVDMREFLPFKSYKLLDAAWVMCCGQDPRPPAQTRNLPSTFASRNTVSQLLRGPDDQEYELNLSTSRAESSQVFVRFSLFGAGTPQEVMVEATAALSRTTTRKIADLRDQATLLEKQIQEAKSKVDVGLAPGTEIPKLEVDLRRVNREIEDLTVRLAEQRAGRAGARNSAARTPQARSSIIDTSFTMDVGETVVVGTSRLKGGSRALIALLTAVPPRGTTEKRE